MTCLAVPNYDGTISFGLSFEPEDSQYGRSQFQEQGAAAKGGCVEDFFSEINDQARGHGLLSDEHFSVDGTLLDAWASMKSLRPKGEDGPTPGGGGRNRAVDFRGERRVNETHESKTDPGARLARKGAGKEAHLCYAGHVLMDNLQGLVVDVTITEATGTSERDAALDMLQMVPSGGRITVGADRGVRHQGLRMGLPGHAHHTSRGPEKAFGDRWTDHPARWIQFVSACPQTG